MLSKEKITDWLMSLQDDICHQLLVADGTSRLFREDFWERKGGGGGRTRVLENGNIIEKGGVNFSAVHGQMPEKIATALGLPAGYFFATGVSIVLHPHNPFVPIIHMNVRYFEMEDGTYWFGGGIDLTPHYVDCEDAHYFHRQLKKICDQHHPSYYPMFKKWADDYFFIKHRQETRGIGGIFFDRLSDAEGIDKTHRFAFLQSVGNAFAPIYTYFMQKNHTMPFSEREKQWQLLRRGRYVEFNLVYDKGTKFGLDTDGRIESILMSLPPLAQWMYDFVPEKGSPEEQTLQWLKKGIDW
ncbi:MAG: oxygen-dependent coproporphyrinogen oxidase [Flammeovirgaceae bacterium]|nr:oxygen-dependent coproporphyrinogen oxidase [Flammeovirgaceae bacterium]MDW8288337.1 oxygen-dependent coproporphyrinogen oxidase [Flammeovirgaceae bacterium]